MIKLGVLILLAVPYIGDCDSPTQSQCEKARAIISQQESLCSRLDADEKLADSSCSQVVDWHEQKCGSAP